MTLKTLNAEINANNTRQKNKMDLLIEAKDYNQRIPLTVREFNKIYGVNVREHQSYFQVVDGYVQMTDWGKQTIKFIGM